MAKHAVGCTEVTHYYYLAVGYTVIMHYSIVDMTDSRWYEYFWGPDSWA
jgi:hypothetical protein